MATVTAAPDSTTAWLLAGDPAIRLQTLADLKGSAPDVVAAERARVASEGWGARLLALQDRSGRWADALYSPKWTSTTYTLLLLHWFGLPSGDPRALAGCAQLWDGAHVYDGGINLAKTVREPETCITGMLVLLAASFGFEHERVRPALEWQLGQQLEDGGWNCETVRAGSRHGSFHTTITVLEALLVARTAPWAAGLALDDAAARGRAFLLAHRLFRSHRTGAVADPALLTWRFPPQWHYDVLRGLDHFRAAGAPGDERLGDALAAVRDARGPDGRWAHHAPYAGRTWFALEARGTSRWNTLRAERVLAAYGDVVA